MKISIDIPKTENKGEDAPPINIASQNGKRFFVGVFDGLGGSGSTMYEENDVTNSGAFIASRIVRETTESYFLDKINEVDFPITDSLLDTFKQKIKENLNAKLKKQKFQQSKLKSALIKTFPTTLALGFATLEEDIIKIDTLWAGDSRVYVLLPEKGLIQLTKDDLKLDNDPFQNIEFDSPLSNLINLDEEFNFNRFSYNVSYPAILIAASDGCYGYYSTPMHFENMILLTMRSSKDIDEWKVAISRELSSVSGDDCTIAIAILDNSEKEFFQIKEVFRDRQEILHGQYMNDINQIELNYGELKKKSDEFILGLKNLDSEKQAKFLEKWNKYKIDNYHKFNK